jgi:hypothetical protein
MTYWFLSFVGDRRFLGGCLVELDQPIPRSFEEAKATFGLAIAEAHRQGCNPGGSVKPRVFGELPVRPDDFMNRLLSRDECDALYAWVERRMRCS